MDPVDRIRWTESACSGRVVLPANRFAFERCTDIWQDVAGLTLSSYAAAAGNSGASASGTHNARTGRRARWVLAVVATLVVLVAGLAIDRPWRDIERYATAVGEQRTIVLRDGTRLSLNTATRVRVELTPAQRAVRVETGEALFEVAKDARRPFVVRVAGSEVVALGTEFSVRYASDKSRADESLAVTLIEGRITVRAAASADRDELAPARSLLLQPGDRVRLSVAAAASRAESPQLVSRLDRPRIEQVLAWKRSEAIFDDVSLADAVDDMNRYSQSPIVLLGDLTATSRRVSGQFRTGDNAEFAQALAALQGLVLHERAGHLELSPGHGDHAASR